MVRWLPCSTDLGEDDRARPSSFLPSTTWCVLTKESTRSTLVFWISLVHLIRSPMKGCWVSWRTVVSDGPYSTGFVPSSVTVKYELYSPWAGVTSGVPQGTVLGPLLFLIYINDLPDCVTEGTVMRLFADDCLVYRVIHSHDDQVILDKDLASLQKWSERWGMSFNPRKFNILQVSCGDPSSHFYQLCGDVPQKVSDAKYLGILISSDLSWDKHISDVAIRANYTLGLIRRNLCHCPRDAMTTAYFSLVRSTTDYCSAIWDPYLEKDKTKLERVNRRVRRL